MYTIMYNYNIGNLHQSCKMFLKMMCLVKALFGNKDRQNELTDIKMM